MDAMRFFGFIGLFLAAGVLMAFVLELLSTERAEPREERRINLEADVRSAVALPAFFAKAPANVPLSASSALDEALIAFIEDHVRAEQAMVTKFVHFPSVDSLYRQAKSPTMH